MPDNVINADHRKNFGSKSNLQVIKQKKQQI